MDIKTVKTRIVMVSDTHNQAPYPESEIRRPFRDPFPTADVLIHCGDLTMSGRSLEYQGILDFLKQANAELKLVIAGNHDISLDKSYYERCWKRFHRSPEDVDAVRGLWLGEEAKHAGIVYLEEGTYTYELKNGAQFTVYASPYQPEFCDWAFPYARDEDRFNEPCAPGATPIAVNPVPSFPGVDIMVTHGPPYGHLDETSRGDKAGCSNLMYALQRSRPRIHCFGHIHEGWGAERLKWKHDPTSVGTPKMIVESVETLNSDLETASKNHGVFYDASQESGNPLEFGQETLLVNASIQNVQYNPVNAPWIVDLDLPLAH